MVDRKSMPVEDLIRSQLQSEEEFTDQRSSHFKLRKALYFKLLLKNICPSFDLPFGTIMTRLNLFHVVARKLYHARQTFEINCPFVNSTESLIFDLTKILLPKRLVLTYSLIAKVIHVRCFLQN